jgi:putative endonuclease
MKTFYIYILANKKNGTLYTGMTSNLLRRIIQHKNGVFKSFTKRYDISKLVYFEISEDVRSAIIREKRIKRWKRKWKIGLIEKNNPQWQDLFCCLMDAGSSPA